MKVGSEDKKIQKPCDGKKKCTHSFGQFYVPLRGEIFGLILFSQNLSPNLPQRDLQSFVKGNSILGEKK